MIVREVLRDRTLLDRFDFFNDAADTIRFLRSIRDEGASELADELQRRHTQWLRDLFASNPPITRPLP